MITTLWVVAIILVLGALAFNRASMIVWTIACTVGLIILTFLSNFSYITLIILWLIFLGLAIPLNTKSLRRKYLTKHLLSIYLQAMPKLSKTEREAIAAGTVNWAGDLFSGMPDWVSMLKNKAPTLSAEEQAFINGPVEELCCMIDDWDITHNRADLPPKIWKFLKDHGFFGLIIPKEYGGKDFSAAAHSAIILKVGAYSITAATSIAVPNSLGPAELIVKYGTEEQKNYYLPRLARGEEMPCFALTGPEAGSDASSILDSGIICKGQYDGKEVLGIRLNFNKRYISLAPAATVISLAFRLYEPDHLFGEKQELGITCALVPSKTPGISIGRRHFPLNIAFLNGPIHGKDVFVPMEFIIGGVEMVGHGWSMLVECLSVGRGITLPSMAAGGAKAASLTCGVYGRIRQQFGMPIGNFEGVEEALARIAGYTYIVNAGRRMTVAAIDRGEKPAVLTAIMKYHATNFGRNISNDAMDIHGGKGICLGPNNYLGRGYQGVPISITVEGANILTRSMIIFGQGAIRCHPYVLKELEAAKETDAEKRLTAFDDAVFGHFGFVISNIVRSFVLGITNGYACLSPKDKGRRYYQQLTRFSSALALLTDVSMAVIGGELKRREKISARLGDILSMLYLGSAVLKQFYDNGESKDELPLLHWSCQEILYTIQQRINEILKNFPNRVVACILQLLIFPLGKCISPPSDKLGHKVAQILLNPNSVRDRLGEGLCLSTKAHHPIGRMETLLQQVSMMEPIEKKVHLAAKHGEIHGTSFAELIDLAASKGLITKTEGEQLAAFHAACMQIINVDDFDANELAVKHPKATTHPA